MRIPDRLRSRRALVLIAAALVVVVVACIGLVLLLGHSMSPAEREARDEAEIEHVLRTVLDSDSAAAVVHLRSAEMRERFHQAQARGLIPEKTDRSDQGEILYVSNYLIDGDLANADVTRLYPDLTQITTTFVLVREDGKWLLEF
ncbi:Rv0361 family membrane protein [Nocardia aurantia]|uniref:DUF4878 domain-containing protein n=1 Tax=Nocardia aurantia TaxID=2585199 RepID=A0A7K0DRX4_9NOCA|nr:hypothetical protein [Nocardia aurantia]MQY28515.1 hypothetical protein [Nocardia aurantia]